MQEKVPSFNKYVQNGGNILTNKFENKDFWKGLY